MTDMAIQEQVGCRVVDCSLHPRHDQGSALPGAKPRLCAALPRAVRGHLLEACQRECRRAPSETRPLLLGTRLARPKRSKIVSFPWQHLTVTDPEELEYLPRILRK